MADLPKHYHLKKEEKDHYVIHDGRDKKDFKVAKKGIHPAHQLNILRLQKFSEGGSVMDDVPEEVQVSEPDRAQTRETLGALFPPPVPETQAPIQQAMPMAQAPQAQAPQPVQPQMNPMAGFPTVEGLNQMQSQYEKSLMGGASGQIAMNRETAKMYEQKLSLQEQAAQNFQKQMEHYRIQSEQMAQDIAATKIDPKRYWHNKDSHGKAMAALGIMLGGLGQGLMKSNTNQAMDVMQKNIDRDIESQKLELGKKQSLLSDNFRMQGNMVAAEAATRAQYEAIFQGRLSQLAAKMNNPMILAQTQQLLMDSRMKMMQYLQPVAQNQMVMQLRDQLQKGSNVSGSPEEYVKFLVPESHQKQVFEEIKRAQDTRFGAGHAMKAFDDMVDQIKSVKTLGGAIRPEAQTRLESALLPTVQDVEGTVRQTAMDFAKKSYIPSLDDVVTGRIEGKRKALEDYFKAKSSAPTAKGFGLDLDKFQSTKHSDIGMDMEAQRMLQWARANQDKPAAIAVMKRLGVK